MSDIRLDIDGSGRLAARRKRTGKLCAVAVAVLAVAVAATPTLLSTGPGAALGVAAVNRRIAGEVSLDGFRTGWFGGTSLRGLGLASARGEPILTGLDADAAGTGFAGLLRMAWTGRLNGLDPRGAGRGGGADPLRVRVPEPGGGVAAPRRRRGRAPRARFGCGARPGSGGWRPLRRPPPAAGGNAIGWAGGGFATPPVARASLAVERLRWRAAPGAEPFEASGVEARADARDPDAVALSLRASTTRAGVNGALDGRLTLLHAATRLGVLRLREAGVEAEARVEGFPVAVLAEWLGVAPGRVAAWEAAVGPSLGGSLRAAGTLAAPRLDLARRDRDCGGDALARARGSGRAGGPRAAGSRGGSRPRPSPPPRPRAGPWRRTRRSAWTSRRCGLPRPPRGPPWSGRRCGPAGAPIRSGCAAATGRSRSTAAACGSPATRSAVGST